MKYGSVALDRWRNRNDTDTCSIFRLIAVLCLQSLNKTLPRRTRLYDLIVPFVVEVEWLDFMSPKKRLQFFYTDKGSSSKNAEFGNPVFEDAF